MLATLLTVALQGTLGAGTSEYAVKAAYLYNFAKFTEWPNTEQLGSLTVCLYGKDPFGDFWTTPFGENRPTDCPLRSGVCQRETSVWTDARFCSSVVGSASNLH
jgi:hypothetical protein